MMGGKDILEFLKINKMKNLIKKYYWRFSILSLFMIISVICVNGNPRGNLDKIVPFDDFFDLDRSCSYYLYRNFDLPNDSVVPYLLYEYDVYKYKTWKGVLLAIPKKESNKIKMVYSKYDFYPDTLRNFYKLLFDHNMLVSNFDLYVYYLPKDQLTNLDKEGEEVVFLTDDGLKEYDWSEKEDALALLYKYDKNIWTLIDSVLTEGHSKFRAFDFADELLRKEIQKKNKE